MHYVRIILPEVPRLTVERRARSDHPGDSPRGCQRGPPRHNVECVNAVDGEHRCVWIGFHQRLQNVRIRCLDESSMRNGTER